MPGLGPELHESGDLAADERDVPGDEKYVVDEGPKYRNRDTIYSLPSSNKSDVDAYPHESLDFADVGEMFEFTDLLHQAARTSTMTTDDFMAQLMEQMKPLMEGGEGESNEGGKRARRRTANAQSMGQCEFTSGGRRCGKPAEVFGRINALGFGLDEWVDLCANHAAELEVEDHVEGGGEKRAGMSPSRETQNLPTSTVVDTTVRLEHRKDRVDDWGGELSNDEEAALKTLMEEEKDRGIKQASSDGANDEEFHDKESWVAALQRKYPDATLRDAGQGTTLALTGNGRGEVAYWDDSHPSGAFGFVYDKPEFGDLVAPWGDDDDVMEEHEPLQRREASRRTAALPFPPNEDEDDAPMPAMSLTDDADADDDEGPDPEMDPEGAEDFQLDRIEDALEELRVIQGDEDEEDGGDDDSVGEGEAMEADGDDEDKDADGKNPFAGKSARALGRAVHAALRPEAHPSASSPFRPGYAIGMNKTAAVELPENLFGVSSDRFSSAERSLAALHVNRGPERRGRHEAVQPMLVEEAARDLRKALGALRKSYSVESYVLERTVTEKIAQADGSLMSGEFHWHVRLADHARRRSGNVDLIMRIEGGSPVPGVQVLSEGRRMPFTRSSIDRHLNIRRDATRAVPGYAHVDRALIEE